MTAISARRDRLLGLDRQGLSISRFTGSWAAGATTASRRMPTAGTAGRARRPNLPNVALAAVAKGYRALKFDPFGTAWKVLDPADADAAVEIVAAGARGRRGRKSA